MGEHVTVDGPAALHVVPGADHSEEQRDHSCPFTCQLSREQIQRQEPQTAGDQERQSYRNCGKSQYFNKWDHTVR